MTRCVATVPAGRKVRLTLAFALGLTLAACASSPRVAKHLPAAGIRPEQDHSTLQQEQGGFTLAEEVRVPADVRTDFNSAVQLLTATQYDRGIALLLKVTQKAPDLAAAHVDLGIAYERTGDLAKAQASLERALALDPRHVVAYNELGMVLRRQGQFSAARASYEKALAVAPNFRYARLNLAILCDLYLADAQCALTNYQAYQQQVPDDERVALWIRDLHARTAQ